MNYWRQMEIEPPRDDGPYLVCNSYGMQIATWNGENNCWDDEYGDDYIGDWDKFGYWMELPESPYKKVKEPITVLDKDIIDFLDKYDFTAIKCFTQSGQALLFNKKEDLWGPGSQGEKLADALKRCGVKIQDTKIGVKDDSESM